MIAMTEKLQSVVDELKVVNAETYYHSLHVKTLVFKMIQWMNKEKLTNYTPQEIDSICKGAILHDVGKLGVKNAVLTKDSSLTPAERSDMSHHTSTGFAMIQDELSDGEYDIIKNICLYHHERTDGKGYEGKNNLPTYVQIVSICDVFDALRTDRVYRKGFSYSETMRMIKDGNSGHFDEAMIACLEKVTGNSEE